MGGSLDDESDEVMALARRARGGEFVQVLPELSTYVRSARSVPARMAAAVAVADVLVWDDLTIPVAADLAEEVLGQACDDPRWELVKLWRPLVDVVVGAQVHHGVPARPRLIRLAERAAAGRADRLVHEWMVRTLRFEVPEDGAPAKWRSHMPPHARETPMHGPYYEAFRAGPQEWADHLDETLWALLVNCREGPEIAAGLLAAGHEPGDDHAAWLWLVGHFLEDGDRAMATWALQGHLRCWRDPEVPSSVLPRRLPLFRWTRPLLDPATRSAVLSSPIGPSPAPEAGEWQRFQRALRGRCSLEAACVTVAAGCSTDDVLRAFGANPAEPAVPWVGSSDDVPGVSVLELPGGVLAVEDNGFAGCAAHVMRAASAHGRAAGFYWNAIGDQAVMFAEKGEILDGGDYLLGDERLEHPAIAAIVDDIAGSTDDPKLIGLLAVERFTGVRIAEPATPSPMLVHRIAD